MKSFSCEALLGPPPVVSIAASQSVPLSGTSRRRAMCDGPLIGHPYVPGVNTLMRPYDAFTIGLNDALGPSSTAALQMRVSALQAYSWLDEGFIIIYYCSSPEWPGTAQQTNRQQDVQRFSVSNFQKYTGSTDVPRHAI